MCFVEHVIRPEHLVSGAGKRVGMAAGCDCPGLAEAIGWIYGQLRACASPKQRWAVLGSSWLGIVIVAVMYCNDQFDYTCEKSA